jgi:hypothetical protein
LAGDRADDSISAADARLRESRDVSLRLLKPMAWIALYLAVIEVGLEYRAHTRGYDTLLIHRAAATVPSGTAKHAEYGPTLAFPFRSAVVTPAKVSGVRRVWIASSSHAEDTGLPAADIFPNRLGQRLSEAGCPTQVINASRAGQTLTGHTKLAQSEGDRWQPDIVVLYQMSNDIGRITRIICEHRAAESPAASAAELPGVPLADRLVEQTSTWPLLKTNLTPLLIRQRVLRDELGDEADRIFESQLRELIAAWKSHHATPVLCTFATSHDSRNVDAAPLDTVNTILRYNMHLSMRGWVKTVEKWNTIIRRVAGDEKLAVIDVNAAVAGKTRYFRDFVHFTREGHDVVARTLAEGLRSEAVTSAAGDEK